MVTELRRNKETVCHLRFHVLRMKTCHNGRLAVDLSVKDAAFILVDPSAVFSEMACDKPSCMAALPVVSECGTDAYVGDRAPIHTGKSYKTSHTAITGARIMYRACYMQIHDRGISGNHKRCHVARRRGPGVVEFKRMATSVKSSVEAMFGQLK